MSAVIVAAGNSSRMGLGKSKQFIDLLGEPVISRTLNAFEKSPVIDSVVVVCREVDRTEIENIINEKGYKKVRALTGGGAERADSVKNGIAECDERTTHYAIHDGARPLISGEDITAVVNEAFKCGAAALGTYVTDTIKVVNENNEIVSTPARSELRAVQTPQVFYKEQYIQAYKTALQNKHDFTDDCQLIESIGEKVHITIGNYENIKITTPEDITIARALLHLY